MKKRILVASSACMDFCVTVERFPRDGEENVWGSEREYRLGGRGAAISLALVRGGADCVFCGRTGADPEGARLRQVMTRQGVDMRFFTAAKDASTDFTLILTDRRGACRSVSFPGASALFCREDVEGAFTSYPDAVFLDPEIPENAAVAVIDFAREQGVPVALDFSYRHPSYRIGLLGRGEPVELLVLNPERTRYYTDVEPSTVDNCLRAVIKLSSILKFKYCVIKLGERGYFLYDNKYHQLLTSRHPGKYESQNASDAFSAALAGEYFRTGQISAALKYADAVSAIVERDGGGLDSIPGAERVREFLETEGTV